MGGLGFTLQLVGYGLFWLAISSRSAPISVLYPLSAFGVVVIACLAVFYLKERFSRMEWLGVALLLSGVVLLGSSLSASAAIPAPLDATRWLMMQGSALGLALFMMGFSLCLRQPGNAEVLFGVLAGLLLGIGFLNTKVVSLAWLEGRHDMLVLSLIGIAVGLPGGLAVLLKSFLHGRALIVITVNFVVNQMFVVAGGWLCLGEKFPDVPLLLFTRMAGLLLILTGILTLAWFHRDKALPPRSAAP
jgi:multidrug transporter EmrE-like cation transporter